MPNIQHNAVCIRNGVPLISCFRWAIAKNALPGSLLDATEAELLSRSNCVLHETFVGSYLLGLELSESSFPRCAALLQGLSSVLVYPLEELLGLELSFSFIKYAVGVPPSSTEGVFYEGEHVDSHPRLENDLELFRVLFSVACSPRYFRYRGTDSRELCKQGFAIGRSEFRRLALPDGIKESTTIIPGRGQERISWLCFWASVVPHVGVNTIDGYFLISFEGVAPFVHTETRMSANHAVEISNQTAQAQRLKFADDGQR